MACAHANGFGAMAVLLPRAIGAFNLAAEHGAFAILDEVERLTTHIGEEVVRTGSTWDIVGNDL